MEKKQHNILESSFSNPITFDSDICINCNRCVDICQVDVFIPNHEKDKPPIVLYPGECWYCGCCVMECPKLGAIRLNPLLKNRVHWRRKV
ncbi:MAG: ferredoxin family protein [Candidatus Lokiarchaeota archaeon]|nr:ferredoxin family protein [Candidatus Lokiarchaeota archaeon]